MSSAVKQIVEKFLDWGQVEDRLSRFRHIRDNFDVNMLKGWSDKHDKQPYYCHYLAWRLGTWHDEKWINIFDDLLEHASSLDGWKNSNKQSLANSPIFEEFFSFLWELQMAKYLFSVEGVSELQWLNEGPDLKLKLKGEDLYVECYAYRKSFGLELFIEDLLRLINKNLRIDHSHYIRFSLPNKPDEQECLLNKIFEPLLDKDNLNKKIREAAVSYPVILFQDSARNIYVYLDGDDPDKYAPGRIPNASGDPEEYLKVAICEAMQAKNGSNGLINNHPNLLAVNFLISGDFQSAINSQRGLKNQILIPDLADKNIDALLLSVCGIDEMMPDPKKSILEYKNKTRAPRLQNAI